MNSAAVITLALAFATAVTLPTSQASEVQIPRSMAGDKGKYFLISAIEHGPIITTLHKRVGPDSVGYTKSEVNCTSMQIRNIGYSESGVAAIKDQPGNWSALVQGSSKSDLVNFVCKRTKK